MACVIERTRSHRAPMSTSDRLPWCWALLLPAAMLTACGGTTEAGSRVPLTGAGGADSSLGGADSSLVQTGGAAGRDGGTASGGSRVGTGGASSTGPDASGMTRDAGDGRACVALDQVCAKNTDCCSGYCSTYALELDGGLFTGETPLCYRLGCTHEDQPCRTSAECCDNVAVCRSGLCRGPGH